MKIEADQNRLLASVGGPEVKSYDNAQILQWHVLLRIVVAFFILFSTIAVRISQNLSLIYLSGFYTLIGINVMVTLLSAFFIGRYHNNVYFLFFQVFWDILFLTGLIYVSGGTNSLFNFMYILSVFNTSILLGSRGTLGATLAYLSGYILVVIGQQLNIIHPLSIDDTLAAQTIPWPDLINKILLNGSAMLVAAWLFSKVTDQAKQVNKKLRQKQSALEELKALNEHMIQSIRIGLVSLDPDGRIVFVNQYARNILGSELDEYIGESIRKLFPNVDLVQESSVSPLELAFGTGEKQRHLSISWSVLNNEQGQNIGWIVPFQDVTELRRMEQEVKRQDRLAAVGKLAAGIAHEIRNPLASMSGSIQLMQNELELDPVNKSLMDIVVRETDRLNMLITDFLVFARPERMRPDLVDLSSLLNDTLGILQNDPLSRSGVTIQKRIQENLFVNADSDQLRQLFWNLLKNALQAMPEGGTLTTEANVIDLDEQGVHALRVRISDTGEGMDEETVKSIFDPFFTTKEMGTGLGLTTAYRIVENHMGKIWCESKPETGTTFFILLPTL